MSQTIVLRLLKSSLVYLITYYFCQKFFPGKKMVESDDPKLIPDKMEPAFNVPKGVYRFQNLKKRFQEDRALRIALFAATAFFGYDTFQAKILSLICSDKLVKEPANRTVKINMFQMAEELDLLNLKENVRKMLIKEDLTQDQKVTLLKIKLDSVLNSEYPNQNIALIAILTAIMAAISVVGPYGITTFLAAIHQLWQEGKISTAVYKQMKAEAYKQLKK